MFDEDSDSEEEEEKAPIKLSDDIAEINIEELDVKEEEDPLKEIESKIGEQLVLNL
jgi:hypothetical protein